MHDLAPQCQLTLKFLRAPGLPVCVFQQHTELVATDAVTVAAVGIGFFDAAGDLG